MSAADIAARCVQPWQQAQELVEEIRKGHAPPDALHVTQERIRFLDDGEQLRIFTRSVQKALEAPSRVGL